MMINSSIGSMIIIHWDHQQYSQLFLIESINKNYTWGELTVLDAEFLALLDFWVGEGATLLSGSPRITVRYLSHLVLISSTTRARKCIWWVQNGCILSTTKWGETLVWSSSSALLDVLRWCEELLFNCNATVEEEQSLWRSIKKKGSFLKCSRHFSYLKD